MALGKKGAKASKKRQPRRSWTDEKKRAIVAEAQTLGAVKTQVSKKHRISDGLLYKWEKWVKTDTLAPPSFTSSTSDKRVVELALAQLDQEIERLTKEREELRKRL
jgi:transposase-like protein